MQKKSHSTNAVVEAGLISALIVVIMLLSVYVPIFDLVGAFILPIPVTILYVKHGFKITLTSVVASGIIVAFMYNPISALVTAFLYGSTGITLGFCIKKNTRFGVTISLLAVVSLIGIIVKFAVYILFINKNSIYGFINNIGNQLIDVLNMSKDTYISMGVDKNKLVAVDEMINALKNDVFIKIIPGAMLIAAFISAYLNYVITKSIMKKFRYEIREVTPFTKLYVPNIAGAVIIIVLCIGTILTTKDIELGTYIQSSAQIIMLYAFMVDGMAVAAYYLITKYNRSKKFVVVLLVITCFIGPIQMIYFYIGIVDLILDFRKLDPNRLFKT